MLPFFNDASTAYLTLFCCSIFIGMISSLTTFVFDLLYGYPVSSRMLGRCLKILIMYHAAGIEIFYCNVFCQFSMCYFILMFVHTSMPFYLLIHCYDVI